MSNETFFEAMKLLAKEKDIRVEVLVEKIRTAIAIAIRRDYRSSENILFDIDPETNRFAVAVTKTVTEAEDIYDVTAQISPEDAVRHEKGLQVGDVCHIWLDTTQFGRIAAQAAKQVIKQGIKEAEREKLMEQWGGLQNEAATVKVTRVDEMGNAAVELTKNEVMLFRGDQIPGETLRPGNQIKVYVSGLSAGERRQQLKVSRTARELVSKLFELEAPEIGDGVVEIKSVSREPGMRSKIAVASNDPNVDPVGACIGPGRTRISHVSAELGGEKIDVVNYSDDPAEFVKQALKPASVVDVRIPDAEKRAAIATVPDNQLSLAIGSRGQNAKLAAKLTGFKIDIVPQSGYFTEGNANDEHD